MNSSDREAQTRHTAETVARRSYGKLIAFLAARTWDVAAAEDALSEAFALALESRGVASDRCTAENNRCSAATAHCGDFRWGTAV